MPRRDPPSDKQLAANRRNAQLSTGPRTPEGKDRSRWNALKHGVLSQALIPEPLAECESRCEYDRLLDTLREDLGCATALEEILVERIATCYWRLARLVRSEAGAAARRRQRAHDWHRHWRANRLRSGEMADAERMVRELTQKLDDADALRATASSVGKSLGPVSPEDLRRTAETLVSWFEYVLHTEDPLRNQIEEDLAAIPNLDEAQAFARYESHLERQLYRALDELGRLQRLRSGQAVPPPLNVRVEIDGDADQG